MVPHGDPHTQVHNAYVSQPKLANELLRTQLLHLRQSLGLQWRHQCAGGKQPGGSAGQSCKRRSRPSLSPHLAVCTLDTLKQRYSGASDALHSTLAPEGSGLSDKQPSLTPVSDVVMELGGTSSTQTQDFLVHALGTPLVSLVEVSGIGAEMADDYVEGQCRALGPRFSAVVWFSLERVRMACQL